MGSSEQQQSVKNNLPDTKLDSVPFCVCNDTEGIDKLRAALDSAIITEELFRSGIEQYGRKLVKLLFCDKFDSEKF